MLESMNINLVLLVTDIVICTGLYLVVLKIVTDDDEDAFFPTFRFSITALIAFSRIIRKTGQGSRKFLYRLLLISLICTLILAVYFGIMAGSDWTAR